MKNFIFIFLFTWIIVPMYSQEQESSTEANSFKTLFRNDPNKKTSFKGMGAIHPSYSSIKSLPGIEIGGRGGIIINDKFALGLFGTGFFSLENEVFNKNQSNEYSIRYSGGYGGLFTEYFFNFNGPINISIPLDLAVGGVAADSTRRHLGFNNLNSNITSTPIGGIIESSFMFVIQPGLSINFNVAKFLILSLNVKWRVSILTHDMVYLSSEDMSNPAFGISLRLGNFGYSGLNL